MPRGRRPQPRREGEPTTLIPLPESVRRTLQAHTPCANLGLQLDRFLEWSAGWQKLADRSRERYAESRQGRKQLVYRAPDVLQAYLERFRALLRELNAQERILETRTRVVVGLGAESVLETNIRLHSVHGFPVIPGSALKGLARAAARLLEGRDGADDAFVDVFGAGTPEARRGGVLFLDAVPQDPKRLVLDLDVMTPHYAPYYQGNEPPADYHNPNPIPFLTLAVGVPFLFALAPAEGSGDSEGAERVRQAWAWLERGLLELGLGAKTTAGYGLWRPPSPSSPQDALPAQDRPETSKPTVEVHWVDPGALKAGARDLWAEVVDLSSRPIRVRLFVRGWEDRTFPCGGVSPMGLQVGQKLLVEVADFDPRTREPRMLRAQRIF